MEAKLCSHYLDLDFQIHAFFHLPSMPHTCLDWLNLELLQIVYFYVGPKVKSKSNKHHLCDIFYEDHPSDTYWGVSFRILQNTSLVLE